MNVATEPEWFTVSLECLYRGCRTTADLSIRAASGGWNLNPPPGWIFWALGFPHSLSNQGVCPEHQHVVLTDAVHEPVHVHVRQEMHGVYYEMSQGDVKLGKITFPTNTRVMQFHPGVEPTDLARQMGRRIADLFGFTIEPDIVDLLSAPSAKYHILRGGVRNSDGFKKDGVWVTEVEYTRPDGKREVASLSRAQLSEWRNRR
jgi:hypothetical protein